MNKVKNKMKKSQIKSIKAREILDSKGRPTIEVVLTTNLGKFLAALPSGTSRGKYEAMEKPAKIAIKNVNQIICPKLKGKDPSRQKEIDEFLIKLDNTKNKSYLGANAILGVSIAVCRAGAKDMNLSLWQWLAFLSHQKPRLPIPSILMIEGGLHGRGVEIQEFMVAPEADTFKERFQTGKKIYQRLRIILKKKFGSSGVVLGQEGAFTPKIEKTEKVLDLLLEAIGEEDKSSSSPTEALAEVKKRTWFSSPFAAARVNETAAKEKIKIILDAAASSFFKKNRYHLEGKIFDRKKLLDFYLKLCQKYPILAIEDPFSQEDWQGWKKISSKFKVQSSKFLIIGDDLTVTNPKRIELAHKNKTSNAVIIKPNQIGTVTETIEAAKLAKSFGWKIMVSHRAGETKDDFISDLAVGLGADFIKAGAPSREERMVKYNRLVRIEEELCQN